MLLACCWTYFFVNWNTRWGTDFWPKDLVKGFFHCHLIYWFFFRDLLLCACAMTISLTGGNFQNDWLKAKISGLYCSPVQPQIVHLDAGRVSGSLQICPEGGHNNQNYALSLKASLYDQNRYSYPIGLFWANWAQICSNNWPNFGPLDTNFYW